MSASRNDGARRRAPDKRLFWVSRKGAWAALIGLHVAALASVLTEYVYPLSRAEYGVERVHSLDFLASYAIYGFVACVALVLLGRGLRRLVMRGERYYRDVG